MSSMRVAELHQALDEFREKLVEHRKLWGGSGGFTAKPA